MDIECQGLGKSRPILGHPHFIVLFIVLFIEPPPITMPRPDDDRIMISALEHYAYCPRQCALIHVEQSYEENVFTLRGNRAHERVDEPGRETREGVRVDRGLPL